MFEYKTQNRGGVGQRGSTTRNEDFLEHLFVGTNHQYMLFFTQKGKCFWMRVFEIPEGSKTSKGRAMQNLINILKISFVCSLFNNNGAIITVEPFKKNKNSDMKNFLLKTSLD